MKQRKKRQKKSQTKFVMPNKIIFLSILIVVLLFGLWLSPIHHAEGLDYSPTPVQSQSLGEDTLTSCTNSDVILHGPQNKKDIALTFDADMTDWMDQQLHEGHVKSYINRDLINILVNTQTPATLFLTGLWIKDYPQDTKNLAKNPLFELANHSYSHPSFSGYCYGLPQLGSITMQEQIDMTQQLLKQYTGLDNKYFRFPGGCVSNDALTYLKSKGMQVVHWDVVGDDGFNNNTQNIIANVLDNVKNGSIIVMHMNGYPNDPKTSEALPTIIATLKSRGYTFVKVSDLLN